MAMYTRESGRTTRPTVKESTTTTMDPVTMANGIRMCKRASVLRNGQMALPIKGTYLLI